MPAYMAVLYPNSPDFKVDHEYWATTHMAMVENAFKPHVLSWKLFKYSPPQPWHSSFLAGFAEKMAERLDRLTKNADGSPPEYSYQIIVEWDSLENCKKCNADQVRKQPVQDDIAKFSNVPPKVIMLGQLVGENRT
ncbi:uncharacterized protein ColSpa_01085 [Colletotrichum spaethianum]|uniref:EthD domain-containing protein n=1 Tax=Colletotrichum spaethianum TaxID=700344 RepID=A0AA37L6J7_9PEZI|nr:uncharacterized protein ColSpa_01085 [Colletotrichum spaethianum]GKT40904.1 hypothetical protein ColSpa_01085 [Colletotrichum spaethianum]